VDLVVQLGAIIQFQEYDLDVPLNAVAARWVAENTSIFPVGHVNLQIEEPEEIGSEQSDMEVEDRPAPASEVDDLPEPSPVPAGSDEAGRSPSVWAPPDATTS
jgi:hypothetical protein